MNPVIELVLEKVRPAVLKHYNTASCAITARITIDVLEHFGYEATPIPVTVMIYNDEARRIIESGGDAKAVYEATLPYSISDPGGPWCLSIGFDDGTWEGIGHVIVYVPQEQLVLDMSIDQAQRPHKGIDLSPLYFTPAEDFVTTAGEIMPLVQEMENGDKVVLIYRHDESHRYRRSPNWSGISNGSPEPARSLTAELINEIEQSLEAAAS